MLRSVPNPDTVMAALTRPATEALNDPRATRQETYAARLSKPCPLPRCNADVGENCRTPNGYTTYHTAREHAVNGKPATKPAKYRLTDAGAQRIETAAHTGAVEAAGQYANVRGDAADRASGDALVRAGLLKVASTDEYGYRKLVLTSEGWRTYWHHRLVIRALPQEEHDTTCPCVKET